MKPELLHTRLYSAMACLLLASVLICGCAPIHRYSHPGHKTFTEANTSALEVGMDADLVRSVFGAPDDVQTMTFGADLGEEWTGTAWIYFTEPDRSLMYARRYKKSVLVFHGSAGNMKLNHWSIEP